MAKDYDFELLKDEKIDVLLKPHPLSFIKYYFADVLLILLAVALYWFYGYMKSNPNIMSFLNMLFGFIPGIEPENLVLFIVFWAALVLTGLFIGVLWISKMPLIYMILIATAGTLAEVYLFASSELAIIPKPAVKILVLAFSSIIGFFLIESYRRGHKYFLTNYRIITVKKFISKEVREIMYDKITDIYIDQSLLGRIFNYGTIIPVSESSLGLGEDAALVSTSAAAPVKKGVLGISFGGKKSVSRPRAATYFSLYGVPNPKKVRGIIGNRQLETKEAPILRRIEDELNEEKED
ncbi:MAG: PH domain-containing protein [Candidatus Bathyarchaeia archaeon]